MPNIVVRQVAVVAFAGLLAGCDGETYMPIHFPDDGGRDAADGTEPDAAADGEPDADVGEAPAGDGAETPPDGVEPDTADVPEEEDGGGLPPPLGELDDPLCEHRRFAGSGNAAGRTAPAATATPAWCSRTPDYRPTPATACGPVPDVVVDVSESEPPSAARAGNPRSASGGSLPASVDGDVLVSLTCGGNDFNDDVMTIIVRATTEAVAGRLQSNYREMFRLLRERYEDSAAGHAVVFLVTNVHDPTGGTGAIPAGFSDGFCATINDPRLIPLRSVAIANLGVFNEAIAAVTEELGGRLVDNHGVFLDHGMNAPGGERWLSDDCAHPTNEGHHQLRREEWRVLTGESW